jgi:uncharacterized protein YdhG (YjbR/CyaY superfamily)
MTVIDYIESLLSDRKEIIQKLRQIIQDHLPTGFEEVIQYKMIGYVVPHSIYPKGYHCDTNQPLPFLHLASQKNHIALYHMGLYVNPALLEWFTNTYINIKGKKPDMGKSCIRFKKDSDIPYELIAELCQKITPQEWISMYEQAFKK